MTGTGFLSVYVAHPVANGLKASVKCEKTETLDIVYLAKDSHAFEETEEDADPGEGQSDQQLPAHSSEVLNTICQLKNMSPEKLKHINRISK